jgi:hypothetical protein
MIFEELYNRALRAYGEKDVFGKNKKPQDKPCGVEDFSLKSLRMWGNKSPTPPDFRPKGRGIKPRTS